MTYLNKDTYLYSGHWCAGSRAWLTSLDGHPCRFYSSLCFLWVQCVSVEYLGVVFWRPRSSAGGEDGGRVFGKVSRYHFLGTGLWDHILRVRYGAVAWMQTLVETRVPNHSCCCGAWMMMDGGSHENSELGRCARAGHEGFFALLSFLMFKPQGSTCHAQVSLAL